MFTPDSQKGTALQLPAQSTPCCALATAGVLTAGLISFRQGNSRLGQMLMRARVVVQGATVALMLGALQRPLPNSMLASGKLSRKFQRKGPASDGLDASDVSYPRDCVARKSKLMVSEKKSGLNLQVGLADGRVTNFHRSQMHANLQAQQVDKEPEPPSTHQLSSAYKRNTSTGVRDMRPNRKKRHMRLLRPSREIEQIATKRRCRTPRENVAGVEREEGVTVQLRNDWSIVVMSIGAGEYSGVKLCRCHRDEAASPINYRKYQSSGPTGSSQIMVREDRGLPELQFDVVDVNDRVILLKFYLDLLRSDVR
ncbi:hypothetical protein ACLOJK_030998 [Asimina triloba]